MRKTSVDPSEAYIKSAWEEIEAWEKGKRSRLAGLGDFALNPAARLTAKMIPSSVQKTASVVIEQTLRLAAHSAKFSVSKGAIIRERTKRLGKKKALGQRLKACDELAKKFWKSHRRYAAAEGAATGLVGLPGFVADIPLLLSIVIREIRSIALCYGFGEGVPIENEYALHILRLGSTGPGEERASILKDMKTMEHGLAQAAIPGGKEPKVVRVKYLVSIEQYSRSLAKDMLKGRLLRSIPLIGVVGGAMSNDGYADAIGKAAYLSYRRRFLEEQAEVASSEALFAVYDEEEKGRAKG